MSDGLVTRRGLLGTALTGAAAACAASAPRPVAAADRHAVYAQCDARHDEAIQRLQTWIRQPSVSVENLGMAEGCDLMMQLLRDAGFQHVDRIPTERHPGVFATLDAGAPRTLGLYFMYDVKGADPKEWSSPPWDA